MIIINISRLRCCIAVWFNFILLVSSHRNGCLLLSMVSRRLSHSHSSSSIFFSLCVSISKHTHTHTLTYSISTLKTLCKSLENMNAKHCSTFIHIVLYVSRNWWYSFCMVNVYGCCFRLASERIRKSTMKKSQQHHHRNNNAMRIEAMESLENQVL